MARSKPQPVHRLQDRVDRRLGAALAVGVLDPKSSQLTDPTALFWSVPVLDKTITQLIAAEKLKGTLTSAAFQTFLSKLYQFRTKIELNTGKKGLESTKNLDVGQQIRLILRGSGVFSSKITAVSRDLIIALPKKDGRILISGVDWIGKTISLYFWRKNDAAYVFDTVVKESGMYNGENVLYLTHTSDLLRTQKRKSIRCACHTPICALTFARKDLANKS